MNSLEKKLLIETYFILLLLYPILLSSLLSFFTLLSCSADVRTEIHSREMTHAHNMEDKLRPEMSVKPSALWQKRQARDECSLCSISLFLFLLSLLLSFFVYFHTFLQTVFLSFFLSFTSLFLLLLYFFYFSVSSTSLFLLLLYFFFFSHIIDIWKKLLSNNHKKIFFFHFRHPLGLREHSSIIERSAIAVCCRLW